ncbi:MAG: YihY/virulence factor BrkB family protein [Verrucomicrobiae bacterium]|nr:YihY/virulence factor BrkB family protein [Verrucomicrobiae bacterium]
MPLSVRLFSLLKETIKEWIKDRAATKSAALAFYTIFSLAPLVIIAIALAGTFFGKEHAREELYHQVEQLIGSDGAHIINRVLTHTQMHSGGLAATLGFIIMFFGASAVFSQLQNSLNSIWHIERPPQHTFIKFIRIRFLSFIMVIIIGILLLASLIISTILSVMHYYFQEWWPKTDLIWQIVNLGVSFALITLLFAMIFKILPDVVIRWSDVWLGAAISAFLFTIGKFLIGLYLSHSTAVSAYGAAGSLIIFLIWIYFSAQILFLGAEFTKVFYQCTGKKVIPKSFI